MKLITIQGTCGSGKTTLIRELIARRRDACGSALLINEEGRAVYDEEFMNAYQLSAAYLRGG